MFRDELGKAELTSSDNQGNATSNRWIAHELHDGLLQWVVGARMQIEAAAAKLSSAGVDTPNLEQATLYLHNALTEGRELIGFLDGQEAGECDLLTSIEKFLEAMRPLAEQRGQSLQFDSGQCEFPAISRAIVWSVLRFVQQAVQNAIQHAGHGVICVRLKWRFQAGDEDMLHASVEDTGCGFDAGVELPLGHYGLQTLKQRANMCGGVFTLKTAPGTGCCVSLDVPVCKEHEEGKL